MSKIRAATGTEFIRRPGVNEISKRKPVYVTIQMEDNFILPRLQNLLTYFSHLQKEGLQNGLNSFDISEFHVLAMQNNFETYGDDLINAEVSNQLHEHAQYFHVQKQLYDVQLFFRW